MTKLTKTLELRYPMIQSLMTRIVSQEIKFNSVPILSRLLHAIRVHFLHSVILYITKSCHFKTSKAVLSSTLMNRQITYLNFSPQVLPARTHPEINMNGTGGYLLSGITVEPDTPTTETLQQAKKPKLDECGWLEIILNWLLITSIFLPTLII